MIITVHNQMPEFEWLGASRRQRAIVYPILRKYIRQRSISWSTFWDAISEGTDLVFSLNDSSNLQQGTIVAAKVHRMYVWIAEHEPEIAQQMLEGAIVASDDLSYYHPFTDAAPHPERFALTQRTLWGAFVLERAETSFIRVELVNDGRSADECVEPYAQNVLLDREEKSAGGDYQNVDISGLLMSAAKSAAERRNFSFPDGRTSRMRFVVEPGTPFYFEDYNFIDGNFIALVDAADGWRLLSFDGKNKVHNKQNDRVEFPLDDSGKPIPLISSIGRHMSFIFIFFSDQDIKDFIVEAKTDGILNWDFLEQLAYKLNSSKGRWHMSSINVSALPSSPTDKDAGLYYINYLG